MRTWDLNRISQVLKFLKCHGVVHSVCIAPLLARSCRLHILHNILFTVSHKMLSHNFLYIPTYLLSNSKEQIPSWEDKNAHLVKKVLNLTELIGSLPWPQDPTIHPCLTPNESIPYPSILSKISFNITIPSMLRSSWCSLHLNFLIKILYLFSTALMCTTCPAHPIVLELIILIFGEEYKL